MNGYAIVLCGICGKNHRTDYSCRDWEFAQKVAGEMLNVARLQMGEIVDRKTKKTAGSNVNELLFQYASGMVAGAAEVIRALEKWGLQ